MKLATWRRLSYLNISVVDLENSQESLLRNLNIADGLHSFFAFFLFI
jgi:hypothetical protein